ncbi:MAG: dienelactone hydrolase family protein [Betaproteobacteria bacterium]|nr:dienelactone hydrolase family protein [Betaproteobacteria bacterium]
MSINLPCHVVEPEGTAQSSVIWLHGLGADGYDFAPIVNELNLPKNHSIRFIFPHAPQRPVTINNGMVMRAWYDIAFDGLNRQIDMAGVAQSVNAVANLIDIEIAQGIASERIIIAGFSQGGAIALTLATQYSKPLAGFMALSTYLPQVDSEPKVAPTNKNTPILMVHGTLDNVVPITLGKQAAEYLIGSGSTVEWHQYAMGHSVCWEEIQLIGQWVKKRLATTDDMRASPL